MIKKDIELIFVLGLIVELGNRENNSEKT